MAGKPLAYRRYARRMAPITLVYLAAVALASWLVPDHAPPSAMTIALALLPGIAVFGWIWAMGRLLIELDDEYLRMLEVRKFLVATAIMLSGTSIWGMIELFTTVPRLPVFFVFPLWCGALMIGGLVNRFAFGDGGGCA